MVKGSLPVTLGERSVMGIPIFFPFLARSGTASPYICNLQVEDEEKWFARTHASPVESFPPTLSVGARPRTLYASDIDRGAVTLFWR